MPTNTAASPTFDIIGDVHGMRQTLAALVNRLGHTTPDGTAAPHEAGRELIFVGDLLDRGPDPMGCLEWVQHAAQRGVARLVLGNHELNALHFMTGLRPDNPRTRRQFGTTVVQIEAEPGRWERARGFLERCPLQLTLDEGRLRVIHACWQDQQVTRLPPRIDPTALRRTASAGDLFEAVECCLKGLEEPCPPFRDKDGHLRRTRRVPWWERYPDDAPVVVFGHYWFPWRNPDGTPTAPTLLGSGKNAVCVDYSAGLGGPLVALRYPELEFVVQPNLDTPRG